MIAEIAEVLLAEPRKLKKLSLFIVKVILSISLAGWLYIKLFGAYNLIELDSYKQWSEFLLSGRMLMCILLYLLSYFVLFYLIESFLFLLISWLFQPKPEKALDKTDGKFIITILKLFQLLHVNPKQKEVKLMQHSDDLYELAIACKDREGKRQLNAFKHSLLNEIFFVYSIFLAFYFTELIPIIHTTALNYIVIGIYAGILLAYNNISMMIDMLHKIAPDLIKLIDTAKFQQLLEDICKEEGIFLHEGKTRKLSYKYCYYKGRNTVLIIINEPKRISEYIAKDLLRFCEKEDKNVWVFTNREITSEAAALSSKSEILKIISYSDESDLKAKVRKELNSEYLEIDAPVN